MNKALFSIFLLAVISNHANAQACVAVRQMGGMNTMTLSGQNSYKGELSAMK